MSVFIKVAALLRCYPVNFVIFSGTLKVRLRLKSGLRLQEICPI